MNIKTYFYGMDYHIAELTEPDPDVNYNVDLFGDTWYPDVDKWCEQTFGPTDIWGENPVNGWKRMQNKYFFTSESLLNMFVLRWS